MVDAWSDDRTEALKKLYEAGLSASQIAAELGGGISRNAVIGKVHRLGLIRRGKRVAGAPRAVKSRKSPKTRLGSSFRGAQHPPPAPAGTPRGSAMPPGATSFDTAVQNFAATLAPSGARTILELGKCMCRWPVGNLMAIEGLFCGVSTGTQNPDEPYCLDHSRTAFGGAEHRIDPGKTYRPTSVYPQLKHNGNYRGR